MPTSATRLPVRSTSWRQRAVWNDGPAKSSRPGIGGTLGTESWPQAVTSTSASCGPAVVSSVQRRRGSSKLALVHLGAQPNAVEHAVAPRHVLHVGLDLCSRRVAPRPVRVGREGELVEVRGHVAGDARIGVEVPDAADPVAALEDRHVVVALPAEHHGRADPAEAAAHDGHRRHVRKESCRAALVIEKIRSTLGGPAPDEEAAGTIARLGVHAEDHPETGTVHERETAQVEHDPIRVGRACQRAAPAPEPSARTCRARRGPTPRGSRPRAGFEAAGARTPPRASSAPRAPQPPAACPASIACTAASTE